TAQQQTTKKNNYCDGGAGVSWCGSPGRTLRRPDTIVNDRKWQRILPFCNVSDRKAP
ncbi:unnamed protein product, partial [Rotaria magnacalcarata]